MRSAAAQAVDEIGEADLAGAAEALGGDNRLNLETLASRSRQESGSISLLSSALTPDSDADQ